MAFIIPVPIPDNFYVNDDIENLKNVSTTVDLFNFYATLFALELDQKNQTWFYNVLVESERFKVLDNINTDNFAVNKALIDFNGLPTHEAVELAVETIFGDDAYIETPLTQTPQTPVPSGVLRVFIPLPDQFDNLAGFDEGDEFDLSLSGNNLQLLREGDGIGQDVFNLLLNFIGVGIKLEVLVISTFTGEIKNIKTGEIIKKGKKRSKNK